MSIGNQTTVAAVNNMLSSYAVQMRNLMGAIRNEQEEVTDMGVAGLEALGFDSADAASVISMFSYMNTISGVYFGTATQGTAFDFDNALSGLWAGQ
jgi:hypothetical protein